MNKFSNHIEFETLVAGAEGAHAFDDGQANHLAACQSCAGLSRRLANFFSSARPDAAEVPQFVTANLLNIYRRSQPRAAAGKSALRRILGALVFDDWQPQFAVRERLSSLDARQLLYRAGRFEIDLRITFADGKCQVSGQIFPDCARGVINLYSDHAEADGELNEHCEFVLPVLEEAVYNLRAELDGELIEIENLSLLS